MEKIRFVFNDQNQKNSYGFYILTTGISLARFENNPVMLDQHFNNTSAVIGKWQEWAVEGKHLTGVPVFDTGTDKGAEVAGQVERGFIKSCSMGITFKHEDFVIIDGELVLTACELYEVSIVAVPSNANSIRLYADNGDLLTDEQIKELCLSVQQEKLKKIVITKPDTMSKIILSAATILALGLDKTATDGHEPTIIDAAVARLSHDKAQAQAKVLALESEKETAHEKAVKDYAATARLQGKITAQKEPEFVALGMINFELMKSTLDGIPEKASLASQTLPPSGGDLPKTADEFEKLSHDAKLAFKASHPTEYQKLFK